MITGSVRTFYSLRRALLVAACAAPVLLMGAAWWVVNEVVLPPALPGPTAPAEELIAFVIHDKGLPRLDDAGRAEFLQAHLRRIATEAGLAQRVATALRRASPDEQAAFRAHLFDAFKPLVMNDIRRFHELSGEAQRAFLDGRIVEYARMALFLGQAKVDRGAFGTALGDANELQKLLLARTNEQERAAGIAYVAALFERRKAAEADPELRQRLEERIRETLP